MVEAIFFEKKSKKAFSFFINTFLIYGLLFFELPGQDKLPDAFQSMDLILSILFAIPLTYQAIKIFQNTSIKISLSGLQENITFLKTSIPAQKIQGYRFIKLLFIHYIIVSIENPQEFVDKQPFFKRLVYKFNMKQIGSPFKIPVNKLDTSIPKIHDEIKRIYKL